MASLVLSSISLVCSAVGIFLCRKYWKTLQYVCPYCNTKFKQTFMRHMLQPKSSNKILVTCPQCGKKGVKKIMNGELAAPPGNS